MNNNLKNEIIELYNSFDKTESFYEKGYILTVIDYIFNILKEDEDINKIHDDIRLKMCVIYDDFIQYLVSRQDKMSRFMKDNSVYFNGTIPRVEKKDEYPYKYLAPLLEENISYIIESFLQSTDINMYNFYKKMQEEGRILLHSTDNNVALTSLYNSNTIIFIQNLVDLNDIMILLHELAHAYYMHINNYRVIDRVNLSFELKDEISAKIMEVKYIKFLEENNVYAQSLILQNSFNYIMYHCDGRRDCYNNLKYLIASDIALKLCDKEFNLTKYFKHIYRNDVYSLINEKNNEKRLGKVLKK